MNTLYDACGFENWLSDVSYSNNICHKKSDSAKMHKKVPMHGFQMHEFDECL